MGSVLGVHVTFIEVVVTVPTVSPVGALGVVTATVEAVTLFEELEVPKLLVTVSDIV